MAMDGKRARNRSLTPKIPGYSEKGAPATPLISPYLQQPPLILRFKEFPTHLAFRLGALPFQSIPLPQLPTVYSQISMWMHIGIFTRYLELHCWTNAARRLANSPIHLPSPEPLTRQITRSKTTRGWTNAAMLNRYSVSRFSCKRLRLLNNVQNEAVNWRGAVHNHLSKSSSRPNG